MMGNTKIAPFGRIPSHWNVAKVRDEALIVTDYVANGSFASLKENVTYRDSEDYAVLIRQVDFNNNFSGPFVFVDQHAYDFLSKSHLYGGEIIISNVGNVGIVFRCPKLKYHMALAPNVIMTKFKGDDGFYQYWFKSPLGQQSLHSIESGSAQPKFNKTSFKDLDIPVPPIDEQKKIAAVLGSIDDKIENNRKICANLEAQAQALFKSWFVDFEPFGGKMPKGWKIVEIQELAEKISSGGTPKTSIDSYYDGEINWFSTKELKDGFLFDSEKHISQSAIENSSAKLFPPDSVLMAIYAAPTVGRLGILSEASTFNQAAVGIVPKKSVGYPYVFMLLKNEREGLNLMAVGSCQQNLSVGVVKTYKVLLPGKSELSNFNDMTIEFFEEIRTRTKESRALAEMRDALLPKLMSGEIDVDKVEC